MLLLQNLSVALVYFYFHYYYFALSATLLRRPHLSKRMVVVTYFLNYALFYYCSILELNLILNWVLFFLFLLVESVAYSKNNWRIALFFSLSGILYGLSVNILCRCVVAIVSGLPLSAFDNNIYSVQNVKFIPVFLGFLLGGTVLRVMARPRALSQLRVLVGHPEHMAFQLELMAVMLVYLSLNLLLYQSEGDGVLLKLWGIKSCVFSLVGFYLGLRYSLRMCRLSDYREQNRNIQRELVRSEQTEARLRTIAYRDVLTGTYNRSYAMECLTALLRQPDRFALCFLDLDGLKSVNDRCGHIEGDRYLMAAAGVLSAVCRGDRDILARFGGDEFLLLLPGASGEVAAQRLCQADQRLQQMGDSGEFSFPMSVSYGVVEGGDGDSAEALLSVADEAMYRMKRTRETPRH